MDDNMASNERGENPFETIEVFEIYLSKIHPTELLIIL